VTTYRHEMIDPALYRFVEEQRRVNETVRTAGLSIPPVAGIDPLALRRSRSHNADGSIRPSLDDMAHDKRIVLPNGREVTTRVFSTGEPRSVFVHYHGGGWALGSIYEQDSYLAGIARRADAKVVSVDYPLAPEHQMREILETATSTLGAIVASHPAMPICVGGESAGGHVALASVMRLRARPDLFAAIAGIALCYPITDLSMTPSQRNWGSGFLNLSTTWLEWFYTLALPGLTRDARSDPEFSPLYGDLDGLPPALFCVGELDPLLDDTLFLERRWVSAGNSSRLHVYPAAPHGFNAQLTEMAAACNRHIQDFIADRANAQSR
jgi:acetyl esterase